MNLLKDGRSRSIEMLASELHTTGDDVLRKIEFLERSGIIRRVVTSCSGCSSCPGNSKGGKKNCPACMPKDGFKNMGIMWEVVI